MRDLVVLVLMLICGYYYYIMATSKSSLSRQIAFWLKIVLLVLSLCLAFLRTDFILLGPFAFGGRSAIMIIIEMEIADAFVDRKNRK